MHGQDTQATRTAARRGGRNRLLYVIGALGGLLFGYDTGIIAGAILFIKGDMRLDNTMEGLVVSSILIGAVVGAGSAGPLADRYGRRVTLLVSALVFSVGALGTALASGVAMLIVFRIFLGLGVGAASLTVPLYLSEMAPASMRGAVTALNQLMVSAGVTVAAVVGFALNSTGAWRWMLGLAIIPSVVLLVGMYAMPETPRWLVKRGREEEARSVLADTRDPDAARAELVEIKAVERAETGTVAELLRARWLRPALVVGIGLAVSQQITGINTIVYYAPTTLAAAGFGTTGALLLNILLGIPYLTGVWTAIWLVDRVGRRRLLMAGAGGMALSLAVLGIGSLVLSGPALAWTTLACLFVFGYAFDATWGPTLWVVLGEIFPLRVRGGAMSVAIILHWSSNFLVSFTFPILVAHVGAGAVFLGYAVIGVLVVLFVLFWVPETRGRSLESIEESLRSNAFVGGIRAKEGARG